MTDAAETPLIKQFRRLLLADADLDEVVEFHDEIVKRDLFSRPYSPRDLELRAFSTAVVVAYARPFAKSRSSSDRFASPILPDGVLRSFSGEQLALHRKLLRLRDEEFAHTDFAPTELSVELSARNATAHTTRTRVPLSQSELVLLREMVDALQAEIERRIDEIRSRLPADSRF